MAIDPQTNDVFWGEMSPCEHLVQIYEDDSVFMDALEGFVAGGLRSGDGIIIIATPAHLAVLEHRLLSRGIDVGSAAFDDQYIALDAAETLSKFMMPLNGTHWPDEYLFRRLVDDLTERANDEGRRRVRAFGEMVALLWAQGCTGATVQLEHLWHQLCREKAFCLFCAYPRVGFTQAPESSMKAICAAHSKVLPA